MFVIRLNLGISNPKCSHISLHTLNTVELFFYFHDFLIILKLFKITTDILVFQNIVAIKVVSKRQHFSVARITY